MPATRSNSDTGRPSDGKWIGTGQRIILKLIASSRPSSESDYSDLTIVCKDKTFRVHRLLICPRSKYFQSACNAGFKETTSPVHLDDKDPALVEKLLYYLYTGKYDPPSPPQLEPETPETDKALNGSESVKHHPCYFHIRMYGEADYFMIEDLKKEANRRFRKSFLDSVKTETLPFAGIMEELYSTNANYDCLRNTAIQMIVDNLALFRKMSPFSPELMVTSIPEFTYDLFRATLNRYAGG